MSTPIWTDSFVARVQRQCAFKSWLDKTAGSLDHPCAPSICTALQRAWKQVCTRHSSDSQRENFAAPDATPAPNVCALDAPVVKLQLLESEARDGLLVECDSSSETSQSRHEDPIQPLSTRSETTTVDVKSSSAAQPMLPGLLNACPSDTITVSSSAFLWASIAADFSWEQLNVGNWKDVSIAWREVYAVSVLMKAVVLSREGKLQEALTLVDRGILLGAPVFDGAMHAFAEVLTLDIQSSLPPPRKLVTPLYAKHNRQEAVAVSCDQTHSTPEESCGPGGSRTQRECEVHRGGRKIVFRNYNQFRASDKSSLESACADLKPTRKDSVDALVQEGGKKKSLSSVEASAQEGRKKETAILLEQHLPRDPTLHGDLPDAMESSSADYFGTSFNTAEGCVDNAQVHVCFEGHTSAPAYRSSKAAESSVEDPRVGIKVCTTASKLSAYGSLVQSFPRIDPAHRIATLHCPSLEQFLRRHMQPSSPVLLTGVMDNWPAYTAGKWR